MSEFPYQLTVFLDRVPEIGEPVYSGKNGWYAQVAIKRRFKLVAGDESVLVALLENYFSYVPLLNITTLEAQSNDRMPVRFIEVEQSNELMTLHDDLMMFLGKKIVSRFPERDGENYFPHVTAEYEGVDVIDVERYSNRNFLIKSIALLKDETDSNSILKAEFSLKV